VAGQLCTSKRFQQWVIARAGAVPSGVTAQEHAADYIRKACGIASRRELDHHAGAAARFHERIRKPFLEWSGVYA
jgi:succinate dehydrogenase/fumarate reductase flavoprotein subunit